MRCAPISRKSRYATRGASSTCRKGRGWVSRSTVRCCRNIANALERSLVSLRAAVRRSNLGASVLVIVRHGIATPRLLAARDDMLSVAFRSSCPGGGDIVNRSVRWIRFVGACAALLFPLQGAFAADAAYPVRPIRVIVPFVA